jgi:acetoin utilization deacetylase AcuC-like enzyme/GNAT superfamily N-acetyltransferase
VEQVREIMKGQFLGLSDEKLNALPDQLRNPVKYQFRTILFVAENLSGNVIGFALVTHAPDLDFCYLDYIASRKDSMSAGIGGALYEKARDEAKLLKCNGLFFECFPDDPSLCSDLNVLEQNKARLRFYEKYNAYPLTNTLYETSVKTDDDCPPYLVCDFLGKEGTIDSKSAKKIIRAILERKYADYCPEDYIARVVRSVRDNPVKLREPRYIKKVRKRVNPNKKSGKGKLILIFNDNHSIHHVQDRGYVESPVRIKSILKELEPSGWFDILKPLRFSEKHIYEVHDRGYIEYFKRVCRDMPTGKSIYPYIFPIRNSIRPPKDDSVRAGYYCIDTFTPLNKNAFLAAKSAVNCALTCAEMLLQGSKMAYALVRPPGHHAERKSFGGFCYFNSSAIAANYLSKFGKVAMLDIDYHHGNGQQDIFFKRNDVLTVSIHGHPSFAYPYFSGFSEEKGEDEGYGYNVNYPLKELISGEEYRVYLLKALRKIKLFKPDYLVLAFGLDVAKGDPTGTWQLTSQDFEENGKLIAGLKLPLLVVQEGGYKNQSLGVNALRFFKGLNSLS